MVDVYFLIVNYLYARWRRSLCYNVFVSEKSDIGRGEVPINLADIAASKSGMDPIEAALLPKETVQIQGQPIVVEIKHVRTHIVRGEGEAYRDLFMPYLSTDKGATWPLEHLGGPSSLSIADVTSVDDIKDFVNEQETLAAVEGKSNGDTAGWFVTAPPGAEQGQEASYVTTAPGMWLTYMVEVVAYAHQKHLFTDQETKALLARMHESTFSALGALHRAGRKHGHNHSLNFIVSRLGVAAMIDYAKSGAVDEVSAAKDRAFLEDAWEGLIQVHGLGNLVPQKPVPKTGRWSGFWRTKRVDMPLEWDTIANDAEVMVTAEAAAAKLETALICFTLSQVGIDTPDPDKDVAIIRAAEERVLGRMRVVKYPKRSDYQEPSLDPAVVALSREIRRRASAKSVVGSG